MLPARKIKNGMSGKIIGRFPTPKAASPVWWESQLERDCLYHLHQCPTIEGISGQPFRLPYVLDGRLRSYTPDFLVVGSYRQDVIEVKPQDKVNSTDFAHWHQAIEVALANRGFGFVVMTDTEIRRQPLLDNLKWLYRFQYAHFEPEHCLQVIRTIAGGAKTVRLAQLACAAIAISPDIVWYLISVGDLLVDLDQPLTPNTKLTIHKERK